MLSLPGWWSAMRVLATAVMDLPVADRDGDLIDLSPVTSSHIAARPTAHDTWPTFVDQIMWSLMIHGNAFAVPTAVDSRGRISQLEMIHPLRITPAWSRTRGAESFAVGAWLDGEYLSPADVIHWREHSMAGLSWGMSRLKLLARQLRIAASEQAMVLSTYDDGGRPQGYWAKDRPMDPSVAGRIADDLAATFGGRGDGVAVVGDGLRWHQVTLSHADLELLEARRHTGAEAAAVMGVPAHLAGASAPDSLTYSTVRMDMAAFDAVTVSRYRSIIGRELQLHGIDVHLGPSGLAGSTEAERIAAAAAAVSAGLESPAAASARLGLTAPDSPPAPPPAPPGDMT